MSSQNPGISAAGKAAGKTALNPAAGPAAIGGMLQAGDLAEDHADLDLALVQSRLAKAVSDIAKLANVMEALATVSTRAAEESSWDEPMPEIGGFRSENQHRQEAS
jgi:hypothetical protein